MITADDMVVSVAGAGSLSAAALGNGADSTKKSHLKDALTSAGVTYATQGLMQYDATDALSSVAVTSYTTKKGSSDVAMSGSVTFANVLQHEIRQDDNNAGFVVSTNNLDEEFKSLLAARIDDLTSAQLVLLGGGNTGTKLVFVFTTFGEPGGRNMVRADKTTPAAIGIELVLA